MIKRELQHRLDRLRIRRTLVLSVQTEKLNVSGVIPISFRLLFGANTYSPVKEPMGLRAEI